MRARLCAPTALALAVLLPSPRTSCGDPKPAGGESWITFLSHRTGDNLLYRMRPDGTQCTPIFGGTVKDAPGLRDGMTLYREPHWTWQSPDRKHFASWAADSFRPGDKAGVGRKYGLHLGRADGTGPTRVVAPVCEEAAAWSPDGSRLAYAVGSDRVEPSPYRHPPRMTRIYVVAIDGTDEEMVFEQPGHWTPQDWSPDGKKLLLLRDEFIDVRLTGHSDLFELDLPTVERVRKAAQPRARWQNGPVLEALSPVLGAAAPVDPNDARYSPDGKSIAVTAVRKAAKPGEWNSLDFELGVIDRATAAYRKVAWYEEGLRGPICWSPDGSEILFSRPLKAGDRRERFKGDSGALRQEWGLGLWSIRPDGTGERFVTTGWS